MKLTGIRLSRRQAIGTAAGTALGAAALVYGLEEIAFSPKAAVSAGGWPSPLGDKRAMAAHLLRRAGFGYSEADLDAAAAMSYDDLVDHVVGQQPVALPVPADVTNHTQLASAWYAQMATTTAQFPERMALFWHGVLTSDFRNANRLPFVYQQNLLYRDAGLSDLRSLLSRVTKDPLMMRYLNLDASSAASPNENYARELMELFTLGPGNFTESDVREAARALSGLRIQLFDSSGARMTPPKYTKGDRQAYSAQINTLVKSGASFRGTLVSRVHDSGSKSFLGHTGNLGADDVIDIVLAQPACAPFVTRRALTYFATPNPSSADVNAVAMQFRDSKYDLRTLMRAIFRSSAFTSAANYRSLLRSPTDYMVATMRALNRPALTAIAVRSAAGMDQVLYDPPNVAGWPNSSGWVSSSTLLARINFATAATARVTALPDPTAAMRSQLDNVVGKDTSAAFAAAHSDGDRWFALLASPEFQLK
ncbi:MAG: DUF1800 domain-containing protein [Candidatus Dormibacteraeota bacterium]|uniref:DUF1800 domain-containing protein n=1 Tax=Candidatus Aeolococcus gillhamiae TaxID=3127015 RepID=A0A934JYT0_9BACT|nr:DUF1800 domain-containing protein [Candidatus Dormibacteraeota bacterium]